MPNTAETIEKLAKELTINQILLALKDFKTLEELEKYLEALLKGNKN